jgi:hypothetical protein
MVFPVEFWPRHIMYDYNALCRSAFMDRHRQPAGHRTDFAFIK